VEKENMKKLWFLMIVSGLALSSGCTRINPGHVGIVVENAGNDKGVMERPVVTGWQFYLPGKTQIFEYPTYTMTAVWTAAVGEGHPTNEELQFTTSNGQPATGDVSFSYQFDQEKLPHFFVKFRITGDSLDLFTHGYLRNITRQALADTANQYTADDLYFGTKRGELEQRVKDTVNKATAEYGVNVIQFGFLNNIRLPEGYVNSIKMRVQAQQDAQRVESEKAVASAEAQKIVVTATGIANAKIEAARGDAESQRIRTLSITPQILEMKRLDNEKSAIEKWDGSLPTNYYSSGPIPFVNVPSGKR
jgi:regulator of protease activity HflC (stomatin/prohibitin superfamily)